MCLVASGVVGPAVECVGRPVCVHAGSAVLCDPGFTKHTPCAIFALRDFPLSHRLHTASTKLAMLASIIR